MEKAVQRVEDKRGDVNFEEKDDVMNCEAYRRVKLLMKIVERVLERRMRALVNLDKFQFGFMPEKETRNTLYIIKRRQEEYRNMDKKLYMCFVDMEKAFDRLPRKVIEWSMRQRGLPEMLVKAVMSLYEEETTKVRVGSRLSKKFFVKVGVHQ